MKRYIVNGRRTRYTLEEAKAKAKRIFIRTGAIVSIELARKARAKEVTNATDL